MRDLLTADHFRREVASWRSQLGKDDRLTPSAIRVGLLLSSSVADSSVAAIAASLGLSIQTVQRPLKALEQRGHLRRLFREGRTTVHVMCAQGHGHGMEGRA